MKENYEAVYSSYADLLFQLPFVALAVGILFRTQVAMSRTKLLLFGALYSALVYPLVVKYTWGGEMLLDGVLDGFSDFSGGTVVCITGGAAALAAALFRPSTAFSTGHMPPGSFITPGIASDLDGRVSPLSLTGILMLLLGFCGLTMGSNLQVTNIENANAVASVAFNTLLAGAAGIVVSLFFTETVDSRTALGIGVSAGLAAIASWPVIESPVENLTISVLSAGASLLLYLALNNLRDSIDDTGLISGFLGGGTFGALATPFVNPDAVFAVQATGVAIVFLWSFLAAFIALAVLPGGQTIGRV
jgi:Amt family ammonium transporter